MINFKKKAFNFIITIIVLFLLGALLIHKIPKRKISEVAYRYATIFGFDDYRAIEKIIWERDPTVPTNKNYLIDKNSFNPDYEYWTQSSQGTSLTNVETPHGYGIQLSKIGPPISFSLQYAGPTIIYYAEHTYKISFKIKFIEGDFNSFNVGWWSDDGGKGYSNTLVLDKEIVKLNDDWYLCTSRYTFIDNHIGLIGFINSVADRTSFIISDFELIDLDFNPDLPRFEFEYKGKEGLYYWLNQVNSPWNDLNLINNGDFSDSLAFWKYSADALSISVISVGNKKCALIRRGNGNSADWSLYYTGRNMEFKANNEYQLSFKVKPLEPQTIPFNVGFWVDENEGYQIDLEQNMEVLEDGWIEVKAKYTFKENHGNAFFPINSQKNNSSFYITDIQLINLTQPQFQIQPNLKNFNDSVNYAEENFDKGRASRLKFAKELWATKYTWYNKLFGHGYEYYRWYLERYPNLKNQADYPHNPFISVLFYSGIIGLILYLWLLFRAFLLYYTYRRTHIIFFICFLITFIFSFFSGSSPFDPPIMGFFILLPFFIHYQNSSNSRS